MKISGLYSTDVVSGSRGDTLTTAAQLMRSSNVSALPILDGSRLVGILTERDLASAAADGVDPTHAVVDKWMSLDPAVARPDEDSEEVANRMLANGVRHVLVVDKNSLVGVISSRDLMVLEAWPRRTSS